MVATYGSLSLAYKALGTSVSRRSVSTPAASGQVVSRQTRSSASRRTGKEETRSWTVRFGPMGQADFDLLLAAQASALGSTLPILWEPPPPDNGASIPVRFASGDLVSRKTSGQMYEADVEFEEVP